MTGNRMSLGREWLILDLKDVISNCKFAASFVELAWMKSGECA
jgi:hypothetical protein